MTRTPDALTVEGVFAKARERTGLHDIDSDSWRPGLQIVLDEISMSHVPEGGRSLVLGRCVDSLANRLKVHAYVSEHPEVLDQPVERPLFIFGMPRTGTTVASHLLDCDPARRALLNWEAVDTVPPPSSDTLRTDPRCVELREQQVGILEFLKTSGMGAPHWEFADEPTECMFVHQQDFKGLIWDAWTPTTRYANWLLNEADLTSAYEYQKVVLQILQSQAPGAWSLKMPSHAVFLDTLLKVFPDARLVWAHRDPYTATGSLCNLQTTPTLMVLGEDGLDRAALGQGCKAQMGEHVARAMAVRDQLDDDRIFDLHYAELMKDPIEKMRQLYAWAGDAFTPEVEGNMRTWLEEHPQHAHGKSSYTLADYGLTLDELQPVFADYLNRFQVELDLEH